jgi:hypothetical protein
MTAHSLSISTTFRRVRLLILTCCIGLSAACKAPDLKPDFLKRDKPAKVAETPKPKPAPTSTLVDPSLTPRELLTARLVNPRSEDSTTPGLTVGKLIEFADRYLACDCANTRFAKAWRPIEGGYELVTNAGQVHPLRFMCSGTGEALSCYLTEIDRGAALADLTERFTPGGDFIEFIYNHGLSCPRVEPCPTPIPGMK